MADDNVLKEAYITELKNRSVIYTKYKDTNIDTKIYYYFFIVLIKSFGALFLRDKIIEKSDQIYLSWGPLHSTLSKQINRKFSLIEFNYKSFTLNDFRFYTLSSIIKAAKKAFFLYRVGGRNLYNSPLYAFSFCLDFYIFHKLICNSGAKQIYIAGQLDRYTIMSSLISNDLGISVSVIQHGVNNVYHGLYKVQANEVFYLYDFSIPFFYTYIKESNELKFIKIERNIKNDKYEISHDFNKAIAFACQNANPENNLLIIDELIKYCPSYTVIVYPHPNEDKKFYSKYLKQKNVIVTRKKFKNIDLLVTRFSTLGVEYSELGVDVAFVNLDDVESDFLMSGKFNVFKGLNDFLNWLISYID